ncbi:hypothetical protein [Zoogloea sp.]|uniref:hypothetical protein n=1 Tax=Zoogloea sp. TaxID=49181 RepID=UPI0035B257CC
MTVIDTLDAALHAHDDDASLWLGRLQPLLDDPANRRYRKALQATRAYLLELLGRSPPGTPDEPSPPRD